jgi:hypothetical protein
VEEGSAKRWGSLSDGLASGRPPTGGRETVETARNRSEGEAGRGRHARVGLRERGACLGGAGLAVWTGLGAWWRAGKGRLAPDWGRTLGSRGMCAQVVGRGSRHQDSVGPHQGAEPGEDTGGVLSAWRLLCAWENAQGSLSAGAVGAFPHPDPPHSLRFRWLHLVLCSSGISRAQ